MPLHSSDPEILQLMKLLGLPEHVVGFTLRARLDEMVTIECEYYPDMESDPEHTITKTFNLQPIE